MYLAAQAIPRLYAQELMQRASAAIATQPTAGSTATVRREGRGGVCASGSGDGGALVLNCTVYVCPYVHVLS